MHSLKILTTLTLVAFSSLVSAKDTTKEKPTPKQDQSEISIHESPLSPLQISQLVKKSLPMARACSVSVFSAGYGSGVIISPDGLVLTAAHMMRHSKQDSTFKITLEDGTKATAKILGFNRETDFGLLKITNPLRKNWPHAKLAKTAPITGGFCFTYAHPAGILKGRPAQLRIGRITSHSTKNGKPNMLIADLNIQPGDSGGPLFALNGDLIGLDSSAGSSIGFNIFSAIDLFHADSKRLHNGEQWGDLEKAPDGPEFTKVKLNSDSLQRIQNECNRRLQIKHPGTIDIIRAMPRKNGNIEIDSGKLLKLMTTCIYAFARNQPACLGLDDPAITEQLPPLSSPTTKAITIYEKDAARFTHSAISIAIAPQHLITKASLLKKDTTYEIRSANGSSCQLELIKTDPTWDIALLKVTSPINLPTVQWPKSSTNVLAGDLLISKDASSRPVWNIATDSARKVAKKRSIGPILKKQRISKHRAPYPLAIRHALPLYANDAGAPVFNESGELIGIHIARFCRTFGLIIPVKELQRISNDLLKDSDL